ncbi:MAG: alpha/beta hydrolase fold domain-containing protein, partial [SAR324 cluster bacterium]|nr:alpha/beta hydrolase fold domain-containing protein [SAR324 cluster bacterium]
MQANAATWGGNPEQIVVGGDSAGGNLAVVVTHRARARGGVRIAAQVLIHPATDMTRAHESHQRNGEGDLLTRRSIDWFLGHDLPSGHDLRDPEASPLATDFHDLPPVVLVTAGFDPLLDEGHTYGE